MSEPTMETETPRTDKVVSMLLASVGGQDGGRGHDPSPLYIDPQVRFAHMTAHAEILERELSALRARLEAPVPDVEAQVFSCNRLQCGVEIYAEVVPTALARTLARQLAEAKILEENMLEKGGAWRLRAETAERALAEAKEWLRRAAGDLRFDDGTKVNALPIDEIAHTLRAFLEEQRTRTTNAQAELAASKEALAKAVRDEREACAAMGDKVRDYLGENSQKALAANKLEDHRRLHSNAAVVEEYAQAIRARAAEGGNA